MCVFILKGGKEDRVAAAIFVWPSALPCFLTPAAFPRLEEQISSSGILYFVNLWHKNWAWNDLNSHSGETDWDNL